MTDAWDAKSKAAAYSIACGDVMPGCTASFRAGSEPELMQQVIEHARSAHGITEISPEVASAVKAVIVRS